MKAMKCLSVAVMAASVLVTGAPVSAQGIEFKDHAFVNDAQLPIGKPKFRDLPAGPNVTVSLAPEKSATTPLAISLDPVASTPLSIQKTDVDAKAVVFEVLATDRTIREVLQRWAYTSGWKHEQIHWAVSRDFPVEGTASADFFKGDFKSAVRSLLSSTETTDLPVQPCFYINHIIRVVPQAELCDRMATRIQ